tara:strand:- start:2687 stop:4279 length:1593 start_codon:yes stop_codon:yes gene_type:complete
MQYKNGIYFLIDSLRYDVARDLDKLEKYLPNLHKIHQKSSLYHCVANSRSTQFVLPSIFTLSYPLDYGGYDTGIRNRPKSFVELLRSKKYYNMMISNSNQIGVTNGYQRGFDKIKTTVDFKILLEHRIARTIKPRLKKKNDERFAVKELELFFEELINGIENYDKDLWTEKLLKSNLKLAEGFKKEKDLLKINPKIVIKKILIIAQGNYYKFLGVKEINHFSIFGDKLISGISWRLRSKINRLPKIFPFTWYGHISVRFNRFNKKVAHIFEELNDKKKPFFVYFHLMDLHDNRDITDLVFFVQKFKFFFKWLIAKSKGLTNRSFNYDLSLIYIDELIKPIFDLAESEKFKNTVFLFTADHGSAIAHTPNRKKLDSDRFSEMYKEDLEVPVLILNDTIKSNLKKNPLIDSMDATAILLSEMGIKELPDVFKGEQIKKRNYVISEHAGRGSSDLLLNDLYFTLTKKDEKIFMILKDKSFFASAYFDLNKDPNETTNLVMNFSYKDKIKILIDLIVQDRKEIILKRDCKIIYP